MKKKSNFVVHQKFWHGSWMYESKYSRMDQVKFAKTAFKKIEEVWSALGRPYPFKCFKGCLPQILFGLFLNISSNMSKRSFGLCKNLPPPSS